MIERADLVLGSPPTPVLVLLGCLGQVLAGELACSHRVPLSCRFADLLADWRSAWRFQLVSCDPLITKRFLLPSDHGRRLNDDQSLHPSYAATGIAKTNACSLDGSPVDR